MHLMNSSWESVIIHWFRFREYNLLKTIIGYLQWPLASYWYMEKKSRESIFDQKKQANKKDTEKKDLLSCARHTWSLTDDLSFYPFLFFLYLTLSGRWKIQNNVKVFEIVNTVANSPFFCWRLQFFKTDLRHLRYLNFIFRPTEY